MSRRNGDRMSNSKISNFGVGSIKVPKLASFNIFFLINANWLSNENHSHMQRLILNLSLSILIFSSVSAEDVAAHSSYDHAGCDVVIDSSPFTIETPGNYCLGGNLNFDAQEGAAVRIASDNVQIDGRNYCINGSKSADVLSIGIRAIDKSFIQISNLCTNGFRFGILVGDSVAPSLESYRKHRFRSLAHSIRLENLSVTGARFQGIHIRADNVRISGSFVQNIGGTTTVPHSFATGIEYRGVNCRISDNQIHDLMPNGNGEGVGIAVYFGDNCIVENNQISNRDRPKYGFQYGIWINSWGGHIPLIQKNYLVGLDYAFGPFGIFKDNILANVRCAALADRVQGQAPETVPFLFSDSNEIIATGKSPGILSDCPTVDDLKNMALKDGSAEAVYLVVAKLSNIDQLRFGEDILAWAYVAHQLGHVYAKTAISDYSRTLPKDAIELAKLSASISLAKLKSRSE